MSQSSLTFTSFILSLGTTALANLGEVPNPETDQIEVSFEAARQMIDVLEMLRERTAGNLTDEESGLLARLINDLKLRYVEKVRSS